MLRVERYRSAHIPYLVTDAVQSKIEMLFDDGCRRGARLGSCHEYLLSRSTTATGSGVATGMPLCIEMAPELLATRQAEWTSACIARSRRMRSSSGGCVEKRDIRPPPDNGLTMQRWALVGVAPSSGMRPEAVPSFSRALASGRGSPISRAPEESAPYSRLRLTAI